MAEIQETNANIEKLRESIAKSLGPLKDYHNALEDWRVALSHNKSELKQLDNGIAKNQKAIKDSRNAAIKAIKTYDKQAKELDDLDRAARDAAGGFKTFTKGLNSSVGSIKSILGQGVSLGAAFGATTITLKGLTDALLSYNQASFEVSRTQQLFGRGMGDMGAALNTVKNSTILSKGEFMDLSNAIASTYKGVVPTNTEMADMAAMMQQSFGPNVEVIKKKMQELLGIQNKFPAMFEDIKRAQKSTSEAERKAIQEKIALQGMALGMSQQEIQAALAATNQRTADQKEAAKAAEATGKAAQAAKDAQLEIAKASEEAIIKMAEGFEKVYGILEKIPGTVATVAASFAAIQIGTSVVGEIKKLSTAMTAMRNAATGMPAAMGKLSGGAASSSKAVAQLSGGLAGGAKGAAMLALKLGGVVAVTIAAAVALAKLYSEMKKLDAAVEQEKKSMEGLAWQQKKVYKEWGASLTTIKGIKKAVQEGDKETIAWAEKNYPKALARIQKIYGDVEGAANDVTEASKKQIPPAATMIGKIISMRTNMERRLEITKAVTDALKEQIDIAASLGMVEEKDLRTRIDSLKKAKDEADRFAQSMSQELGLEVTGDPAKDLKAAQDTIADIQAKLGQKKLKIQAEIDIAKTSGDPEKLAEAQKRMADLTVEQQANEGKLVQIAKHRATVLNFTKDLIEGTTDVARKELDVEQEFNSVIEDRLASERAMIEQAQFGFGASVAMIKEQVDLTREQIALDVQKLENWRAETLALNDTNKLQKKITQSDMQRLAGAKTMAQAEQIALEFAQEGSDEKAHLVRYWQQENKISSDIFKRQQKVLELTKEMREGYLDAVREMSVGAGEFSKIIGTQEAGIGQIMDTVKEAGGELKLFRTGGKLSREDREKNRAAYEAKKQAAAVNKVTGMQANAARKDEEFIGKKGRNLEKEKEALKKGEAVSPGAAPVDAVSTARSVAAAREEMEKSKKGRTVLRPDEKPPTPQEVAEKLDPAMVKTTKDPAAIEQERAAVKTVDKLTTEVAEGAKVGGPRPSPEDLAIAPEPKGGQKPMIQVIAYLGDKELETISTEVRELQNALGGKPIPAK